MHRFLKIFFIISIVIPSLGYADELKETPVLSDMVEIEADRLDVDTLQGKAVFKGNVKATKGDIIVNSQVLTLLYDNKTQKITSLIADKEVFVLWQDKEATCSQAVYSLDKEMMELSGNVIITKGAERLSGEKVIMDMAADTQVVEGRGGRVKIRVNTQEESGILQWEK